MPKYTVSRTRHYTLSELLEVEATCDEQAIMMAFELDKSLPIPVENLAYDDVTIEEITKEGVIVYSDHD